MAPNPFFSNCLLKYKCERRTENNKGMALKIKPWCVGFEALGSGKPLGSIMWSLRTYKPLKIEEIDVCSRPLSKRTFVCVCERENMFAVRI